MDKLHRGHSSGVSDVGALIPGSLALVDPHEFSSTLAQGPWSGDL